MTIKETIARARKIVIKIGSNTLAKADGTINHDFLHNLSASCAALIAQGKQIVIVSSGAQVGGLSTISGWARRKDIHYRQALCAIGQVELIDKWREAFNAHGIHIGQLLLTKDDFENDHRSLNIRNTLFTLVDEGVVPVINENDSVSIDEFTIGDNDNLSAQTAILWSADVLILFSDIDGVYTDNPKTNPQAHIIETVHDISALRREIRIGATNDFGTGGIETKLQAAEKVAGFGIPTILANGGKADIVTRLADGSEKATLFLADEDCLRRVLGKA
ncbi:MAG: glutamate 5-kinase [Treponemataceae bacterium]|nr:glutamate 5-kinase [Treponemataceae bacterium]